MSFPFLHNFNLKKMEKNNEKQQKQWKKQPWALASILVLQTLNSPFSIIFLVRVNGISL
jgi:hypothetical protein